MKRLLVLLGCTVLLFSGCQGTGQGGRAVEVIIEGGGEFPQFLVGTWKADKSDLEFVFEPNGTISSAVISLGPRAEPGRVTEVTTKLGGKGIFKAGQWTVQYSPDDHELTVEVVVDDFHVDLGAPQDPQALEGSLTDLFTGPVSEDSQIWEAEWFYFPKYIVLNPEPLKVLSDPNSYLETVVFRKQAKTN